MGDGAVTPQHQDKFPWFGLKNGGGTRLVDGGMANGSFWALSSPGCRHPPSLKSTPIATVLVKLGLAIRGGPARHGDLNVVVANRRLGHGVVSNH